MSRIWWCQEHDQLNRVEDCWWAGTFEPKPCRMVSMRLIPDNTELWERMKQAVIVGIEKGKEGFANAVSVDVVTRHVLAALDGETP